MKRSRALALCLSGVLTFSNLQIGIFSASAASKPKILCKKLGQKIEIKTLKFKCVKKNGKLTWNAGEAVKKIETPSSDPENSKQPKPEPSRDPFLVAIEKALDSEIPKINLESLNDDQIGAVIAEDGIHPGNITATKVILKQLKAAQPIMKLPNPPVIILSFTENHIKSEYPKYCKQNLSWFPNSGTRMEDWITWAFVGCLETNPVQVVPMPKNELAVEHIADAIGSDMGYIPIGLGDNTSKIPTWFVRGLKGVAGEYMLSMGKDHWVAKNTGGIRCIDVRLKDLSFSFEQIDKNHCDYALGVAVSRYMVAKRGLLSTLGFINEIQKTGIWSEEICAKFLGISFQQFESEAKQYIKSAGM
jgi:hypothetical protein